MSAVDRSWMAACRAWPRRCHAPATASNPLAAVGPVDSHEDEEKGRKPDQVNRAPILRRDVAQRKHRLARAKEHECQRKRKEQPVVRPAPEAEEEDRADEEAECDSARKEVVQGHGVTAPPPPTRSPR